MAKPFLRRLFGRVPAPASETTETLADRGDPEAQFHLGLQFADPGSAGHDYTQAAGWYLKAAEQDHASAQFSLGMMYAEGHGVPKDDAEAVRWVEKAARRGNAAAQFHLGMKYYRAIIQARTKGDPESRIEAYKWLRLAAAQGHRGSASVCEQVNISMTREEVATGNRRLAALAASPAVISHHS
jgi:hypothetical protein